MENSNERKQYDYKSSWGKYAYEQEENRFLSSDEEDLLKICDCIDLNSPFPKKTSGGIPIHYADGKIYVLKEGPHTRVEGESGSKKSRTVGRGSVITAILNHDSVIVTDPKGEICSDPKIQWLLKKAGIKTYILDFRNFDKDGYNPLSYTFELIKRGERKKAMASIDKFVRMLKKSHEGADDPFWNGQGGDLIGFSEQNLAIALSQIEGGEEGVPPVVTDLEIEKGIVPDVSGMGLKDALYLLENEGYKVNFSGSGRVVSQTPDAGTALGRGHKITLTLK